MKALVKANIRPYEFHAGLSSSGLLNDPEGRWWPDSDAGEYSGEFLITGIASIESGTVALATGSNLPLTGTNVPTYVWLKNAAPKINAETDVRRVSVQIEMNSGEPVTYLTNQQAAFFKLTSHITALPNQWDFTVGGGKVRLEYCLMYI
ncbi:MAG: hypothetical protein GOVbin4296_58 [Prokaryotic dsDNA virus sp.]|nr:MAG: hypothetical protein GOVbin4296_58 [Prokaryotic dsDNA virus sp.]|tara:strand:+ start:258 stop:704 length:447 start_codon:yes stop_codon:yes gene_type:complete